MFVRLETGCIQLLMQTIIANDLGLFHRDAVLLQCGHARGPMPRINFHAMLSRFMFVQPAEILLLEFLHRAVSVTECANRMPEVIWRFII